MFNGHRYMFTFSTSDGAEFRNALGLIIIGGLASSTFLTLLVVPVAYTLYEDLLSKFAGVQNSVVRQFRLVRPQG